MVNEFWYSLSIVIDGDIVVGESRIFEIEIKGCEWRYWYYKELWYWMLFIKWKLLEKRGMI